MTSQPPPMGAYDEKVENFYKDSIGRYLKLKTQIGGPHGSRDHPDKNWLLIPWYLPLPKKEKYHGMKLNVTREGIVAGGIPIGTEKLCDNHFTEKAAAIKKRITALEKLAELYPISYTRLLTDSINVPLDYFRASINTSKELIKDFDNTVFQSLIRVLYPNYPLNSQRLTLMETIARLKLRNGGFDLIPLEAKAPLSLVCNVLTATKCPLLSAFGHNLEPEIQLAYKEICRLFGIESETTIPKDHPLFTVFPPTAKDVVEMFVSNQEQLIPFIPKKAMKQATNIFCNQQKTAIRTDAKDLDLDPNDSLHIKVITSHSQLTRIIKADISRPEMRIPATHALVALRFILWGPTDPPRWSRHTQRPLANCLPLPQIRGAYFF